MTSTMTFSFNDGDTASGKVDRSSLVQDKNGKVLSFKIKRGTVAERYNRSNREYGWEELTNGPGYRWDILQEDIANRAAFCRNGHPESPEWQQNVKISLDNSSILLTNVVENNPYLSLELQTLANQSGTDLMNMILYNDFNPAMSMRAFGKSVIKPGPNGTDIVRAAKPFYIRVWDWVQRPALPECRMGGNAFPQTNILKDSDSGVVVPNPNNIVMMNDSGGVNIISKSVNEFIDSELRNDLRYQKACDIIGTAFSTDPVTMFTDSGDIYVYGIGPGGERITYGINNSIIKNPEEIIETRIKKYNHIRRELVAAWQSIQ